MMLASRLMGSLAEFPRATALGAEARTDELNGPCFEVCRAAGQCFNQAGVTRRE
jgi:hypothetical protein